MVADMTGITDPVAYRAERKKKLETDLRAATDENSKAALGKRIRELNISDPKDQHTMALGLVQKRRFGLNGPAEIRDDSGALGVTFDESEDWPIEFWLAGWDADALSGYLSGVVKIPLQGKVKNP